MRETGRFPRPSEATPLSAEDLAQGFGPGAEVTRQGVRTLYHTLAGKDLPEARAALARWRRLATGAYGHDLDRPSPACEALAACYGVPPERLRPAEMLFAVQTYYAVLVKLLVWQIVASSHRLSTPAGQLARAECSGAIKQELERLESGSVLQGLGVVRPFGDDPFSWYTAAWSESIERVIRSLAKRLGRYDPHGLRDDPAGGDLLKMLYGELFPKRVRHALGEYYTPDWLARHVLDEVGYRGEPGLRLLDPACGSGTFLVMAINRIRAWHEASGSKRQVEPGQLCRSILACVVGFDLNPLAVLSARANYLIAICDLLGHAGHVQVPVFLRDSILTECDESGPGAGKFDVVVGNPPWIAWDHLPTDYREQSKPLWQQYGLFTLSASDARHGGGKKDLSMLMLYAVADRYLKEQGRLGTVVTQTLFQTKGAGDGFRRFRLGSHGAWLRVLRVNDLVNLRPFPGAANWTATVVLEKGSQTSYPVPYVKWSLKPAVRQQLGDCPDIRGAKMGLSPSQTLVKCKEKSLEGQNDWEACFRRRQYHAEPIDPDRPTSPWFLRPEGLKTAWAQLVGPSDYQAHLGANSGGANGVFWVDVLGEAEDGVLVQNVAGRGKRAVATAEQVIEPDLLYPLIRWADVARYRAEPSAHLLLVQDVHTRQGIDEATLRQRYPRTYAYLKRFASVLSSRAAYRRYQGHAAFYSMYNVGPYTVAPVKVVWRRMDRRINAAVVEEVEDPLLGLRPVVPQETCVLVAAESTDEAHYLAAVLNSAVVNFLVASHSVRGGKGFGTPSILDYVRLRRFEADEPIHKDLAAAGRQAHQAAQQEEEITEIQQQIDRLAGRLWGLGEGELDVIRHELHLYAR